MADNTENAVPPITPQSPEDLGSLLSNLNTEKGNDHLKKYVQSTQTSTPINNQLTENLGLNPKDKVPKKPSYSTEDSGQGVSDLLGNTQAWATDPHAYARPFTYGAGWRNMNFDRYYESPGFKDLGYNPIRDNEALYNQHTSLYDDFKRAAPQFANLFGYGVKHMVAPWTADNDAEGYQRAISIGQSSREGVGAFGVNLGLNLGYSAGIIAEMVGEEGALALATIGTGGAAAEVTVPAMATEAARAGKNIYEGWKALNSVKKTFNAVKSAAEARKLFELSKSGASAVAKWLNPVENVAEFTNDAIKGLNGVDKLTTYAKVHKGVGSLVRDMKNIKATWGEANLEGGMAENDEREKLIHDFYDKNGRMPESESEINDIKMRAGKTGSDVALANIGLIYMSNKIVFDTAFKGVPSLKKLLVDSTDDLGSKVIIGGVKTEAKAVGKYSLEGLKYGLKQTPYNLLKGSLKYSTANLVEGAQELGQDVISSAYKDYYDPKYKDDHLAAYPSLSDSFTKGFGEQFSKQGWETFASGFLMGGLMQGPQKLIFNTIPKAFTRITNPAEYASYKANKENYINSIVNSMNDVRNKRTDYINLLNDNFANQKRAVRSITNTQDEGDVKTHKDIQDEAMFDHIHTLLRTGRESFLKEQLGGLSELTHPELSEAFGGLDPTEATKRINSFGDRIDSIKEHYDKVEKAFPNPFELNTVDQKKNPDAYFDLQLKHNVFNFYKKQIVFAQHTFDRTLDRMESITHNWTENKPLANMSLGDASMLLDPKSIQSEVEALQSEISALRQSDLRSDKAQLKRKVERMKQLKTFADNVAGYRQALVLRDKAQTNKTSWTEAQKRYAMVPGAKVKTKSGETLKIENVHSDGRRVKLENGKLYDAKNLEVISSAQDLSGHLDGLVSRSLDALHTTYKDYIKGLAKTTGDKALDSKLDEGFGNIKDYYALNHESYTMANAINVLTNPNSSRNIFDAYVKAKKELEADKAKKVEEGLKTFLSKIENDDLLNGIYQAGVFVLPDELKALVDEGKAPEHFLDATTKQEVEKDSPKYKAAISVIEKYKAIVKEKAPEPSEAIATKPTFIQTLLGKIRVFRHGETVEDQKGINSGPTQEHITPEGAKHVEEGAQDNTEGLTKIVVSSRQRAKDSAEVVAKGKDIVIEENAALDPWDTGDEKTGFAGIPDEDWHKIDAWFAVNPTEKVYAGDAVNEEGKPLKEIYADRQSVESFNEFKDRVLNALPAIVNSLADGGGIMTHSNVIQLLKAYKENGSKNDGNLGMLFVKNEPSKNGEVIDFQRQEVSPTFTTPKVETPAQKALRTKLAKTPQDEALADIKAKLDKVVDEEELDKVIQEIESHIGKQYTSDGIEELIDARKRALSLVVDWSDIAPGDLLVHATYGKVEVVNKESSRIKVKEFSGKKSFYIYKHDLEKEIKHKYREGMEAAPQTAINDAEKKLAKTNQESNVHFTEDAAQMQKLADEAEKEGNKKVTDDFMNDLGCK